MAKDIKKAKRYAAAEKELANQRFVATGKGIKVTVPDKKKK